jgi:hypothetical protein
MRLFSVMSALALAAFIGVTQADVHHNGQAKIQGKGPGRHAVHRSPHGHVAHAHVNGNGKISHISVTHARHTPAHLKVKKVKTTVRRHARAPGREDVLVALAEGEDGVETLFTSEMLEPAEAAEPDPQIGLVFVGWAYFNPNAQFWVFIWFPINLVEGGDQGAENIDA